MGEEYLKNKMNKELTWEYKLAPEVKAKETVIAQSLRSDLVSVVPPNMNSIDQFAGEIGNKCFTAFEKLYKRYIIKENEIGISVAQTVRTLWKGKYEKLCIDKDAVNNEAELLEVIGEMITTFRVTVDKEVDIINNDTIPKWRQDQRDNH